MSELFAVHVDAVSKDSAKLAVRSVHPDSGPPAATSTFALMLLYDGMVSAEHGNTAPLGREMDVDNFVDPEWLRSHARAFIAKAKLTKGVLEVWPTHPAWIAHLREGMKWSTTAYSNGPGDAAAPRAPSLSAAASSHSTDPTEGFRAGVPKCLKEKKQRGLMPLYGASRYVADPIIEGVDDIRAALQSLFCEPVLVVPNRGPAKVGTLVYPEADRFFVYVESGTGFSNESFDFAGGGVKSVGRAWLKASASSRKTSGKQPVTKKPVPKNQPAAKKPVAEKAVAKNQPAAKKRKRH